MNYALYFSKVNFRLASAAQIWHTSGRGSIGEQR